LTLGNFDGVHLGHQAILRRTITVARERGARAGLLSFHPHPASVLAPDRAPDLIAPLRGKLELLSAAGIDFVWIARFTPAFSRLGPESFVLDFLCARVDLAAMVVGYNVSFGRNREGNAERLAELGRRIGFSVEIVAPVMVNGVRVSSTAVRAALAAGNVATATSLLGRPHRVWGRVVAGDRRGRTLGFPTANVAARGASLPGDGVYAVRASVSAGGYDGVANVGVRPTFGARGRTLEVHLFEFAGDLYGSRIRIEFITRIRGEMRFESPAALVQQITRDVEQARRVLAAGMPAAGEP
jgi:riboflavin kinase/FMN adenylyltransferase